MILVFYTICAFNIFCEVYIYITLSTLANALLKVLRTSNPSINSNANVTTNFVDNVTSMKYCLYGTIQDKSWILDSGATNHTCFDSNLFTNLHPLSQYTSIVLPNGNITKVMQFGSVQLSANFCLHDVLYIPSFQFNLLSISKLLHDLNLLIVFYPCACFIQDLKTKEIIAVGRLGGLYKLDQTGFSTDTIQSFMSELQGLRLPPVTTTFSVVTHLNKENVFHYMLHVHSYFELWDAKVSTYFQSETYTYFSPKASDR